MTTEHVSSFQQLLYNCIQILLPTNKTGGVRDDERMKGDNEVSNVWQPTELEWKTKIPATSVIASLCSETNQHHLCMYFSAFLAAVMQAF